MVIVSLNQPGFINECRAFVAQGWPLYCHWHPHSVSCLKTHLIRQNALYFSEFAVSAVDVHVKKRRQ